MGRDLIDRAEALKILRGILVDGGKSRGLRPMPIEMIFSIKGMPSAGLLSEEDFLELRDRFGEYVEFVVRDMISGKGERWK